MGTFLDFPFKTKHLNRASRARYGILTIFILTLAIWGGGYVFVKDVVRGHSPVPLIDLTESSRYFPYLAIYIFWAIYDGAFQSYAYWIMGSLSNNSATLSHYSGWYKSIQSAAAAIVWRLDGLKVSYKSMYLSTWIILVVCVLSSFWVVFTKVEEHCADEIKVFVGEGTGMDGPGAAGVDDADMAKSKVVTGDMKLAD